MATTTGPLMSMEASGTIGKTLTFARWKGRAYVRTRVIPHNPRSAAQYATRAAMAFLVQQWSVIGAPAQATWKDLADATKISPFNAYVQANLKDFTQFLFPRQQSTDARTSLGVAIASQTSVGGVGQITGVVTAGANVNSWGIVINLSTVTGFTPSRADVRLLLQDPGGTAQSYTLTGVTPGSYFVRSANFNTDGSLGAFKAQTTATVT